MGMLLESPAILSLSAKLRFERHQIQLERFCGLYLVANLTLVRYRS